LHLGGKLLARNMPTWFYEQQMPGGFEKRSDLSKKTRQVFEFVQGVDRGDQIHLLLVFRKAQISGPTGTRVNAVGDSGFPRSSFETGHRPRLDVYGNDPPIR
jgi:hypothetical protein